MIKGASLCSLHRQFWACSASPHNFENVIETQMALIVQCGGAHGAAFTDNLSPSPVSLPFPQSGGKHDRLWQLNGKVDASLSPQSTCHCE